MSKPIHCLSYMTHRCQSQLKRDDLCGHNVLKSYLTYRQNGCTTSFKGFNMTSETPRVLIVAEHASAKFGGEAALPLHYFRVLRKRRIEAWLVVHERTRDELNGQFAEDFDRIYF